MKRPDSSMKSQSPLVDAGEALDKAENATKQAKSYPTSTNITQAHNAILHANNAVHHASGSENGIAMQNLQTRLSAIEQSLAETQDNQ